ncbi:MAG: ankyrin repeat domain-containing protein [Acidimicrobiales bacterium]
MGGGAVEERFGPAAMAILAGNLAELADLVTADAELITRPSAVSHPSLLQFVACEAAQLPDPAGAARVLVAAGAELQGPLVAAAGCGSFAVVDVLLDAGADIDGGDLAATTSWTPLDEALYWSNADMAQVLLDRGAGIRALSTAAGLGDLGAIAACFDATGNLTAAAGRIGSPFAETVPLDRADERQSVLDHAFVMAADCGRRAAAADLLERGANIDAVPPGFHWRGTALHAAAASGDADLVRWLLEHGADPTITDGMVGADAAGWARHHGHDHLVDLLTP